MSDNGTAFFPFRFEGPIESHALGTMRYTVIWLPEHLQPDLPLARFPRLRISGELNDEPLTGAWQPSSGRWYLMLSKPLLKATGLFVGATAELRFRVEPQEDVETPILLDRALEQNAAAKEAFEALTAGKKRALAHFVAAAKTAPTLSRRVAQCVSWLVRREADIRNLPKQEI
jgi:hypothetical protein